MYIGENGKRLKKILPAAVSRHKQVYTTGNYAFRIIRLKRLIIEVRMEKSVDLYYTSGSGISSSSGLKNRSIRSPRSILIFSAFFDTRLVTPN